ncbi:MAG TPA: relaxase/mobilization nuclease domain-containing protein [Blastocatellia bacterium]|nr:relaxase/mobilization nuclease domain-containing protein [Blastocatellia bacterium]
MATSAPIAKVSVGKSGYGVAHVSYITRLSALDPEGRERPGLGEGRGQPSLFIDGDLAKTEPTVRGTLEENLHEKALDSGRTNQNHSAADPIWTWNAPGFLTLDGYGVRPEFESQRAARADRRLARPDALDKLTLKEKIQNVKDYFASLEDYERRKGGRTHYRIILSFDVPATKEQIRDLTNSFLEQAFPKAIAFGAIHRDTDHPHVHLYLNSRQYDGRRIQLKNNEFKTIDEKWAKIYADFAGDKSVYVEYLRKKDETRQWKIAAAEAYRKGEPIPPKPERDNDRRERLAEQRLSAQRSDARERGKHLESRPLAEPMSRPASEKETSRLLAKTEVAREQLAHLVRTDASNAQVKSTARIAHEFAAALDKTLVVRKEIGRDKPPQAVYTTEEWKQLKEYHTSRELPVRDDRAAARLQAGLAVAGAELKDAREKVESFKVSRHLWKFDVEGWDRGVSLKEIEQAIKTKTADKFKLYNFLRPRKREEIRWQIDYLQDVKTDIQKQLAARELSIEKNLGAGEVRYRVASRQVDQTARARVEQDTQMPAPVHEGDELIRIDAIANRTKDAALLQYVYAHIRDRVLSRPSRDSLSRVKGRAILARLDMLKSAERFNATLQYGDFRQVPLKDTHGLDYAKSLKETSPRNALETIIRHFTDTPEQKREVKDIGNNVRWQQERAEKQSSNAGDFSFVMDRILDEHCRAAGIPTNQVVPRLNISEIAELREFAEKMPYISRIRREFSDAAQQAERTLQERDVTWSVKETQSVHTCDISAHSRGACPAQPTSNTDRADRDTYSRGR